MSRGTRSTVFAVAAVAILLAVPLAAFNSEDGPIEDIEGVTPGFWAGLIIGLAVGGAIGYSWGSVDSETSESQSQTGEANALSTGIDWTRAALATSYGTYSDVWPLTADHWIRQAEVRASFDWREGREWSYGVADSLLDGSGIYLNEATMLGNAAEQWNYLMECVSERMQKWMDFDFYRDGGLSVVITAGGSELSADSGSAFECRLGTAVRDVKEGRQAVYYAGGPIYVSERCTIIGADGNSIVLPKAGWNDLPGIEATASSGQPGIYYLPTGISFCGAFQQVCEEGAFLSTGMVATTEDGTLFLTYDGTRFSTDGRNSATDADIRVVASKGTGSQKMDIRNVLIHFNDLKTAIDTAQNRAVSAARALWGAFDDIGESNAYMTSLSVPSAWTKEVGWSSEQLKMVNCLVLEQAAKYYEKNKSTIDATQIELTRDSLSFYCRGTIEVKEDAVACKKTGDTAGFSGVAFTPIGTDDISLNDNGANTLKEDCYIVVWGRCTDLGSLTVSDIADAQVIAVSAGSTLHIAEMMYDGNTVHSMDLTTSKLDERTPELVTPGTTDPIVYEEENDLDELIRLVCFLIGAVLLFFGFTRGSGIAFIAGIALIGVGWFLAEPIETMIEGWTDARWLMPW